MTITSRKLSPTKENSQPYIFLGMLLLKSQIEKLLTASRPDQVIELWTNVYQDFDAFHYILCTSVLRDLVMPNRDLGMNTRMNTGY